MSNRWMPKKPQFQPKKTHCDSGPYRCINLEELEIWWLKEIRPLFENAINVHTSIYHDNWREPLPHLLNYPIKTALLIKVEPIQKEDSASGLAKELEEYLSDEDKILVRSEIPRTLIDRIQDYLKKESKAQ